MGKSFINYIKNEKKIYNDFLKKDKSFKIAKLKDVYEGINYKELVGFIRNDREKEKFSMIIAIDPKNWIVKTDSNISLHTTPDEAIIVKKI